MTNFMNKPLAEVDPDIAAIISKEERRIAYNLEMIASENFVSEAVLEASGAWRAFDPWSPVKFFRAQL